MTSSLTPAGHPGNQCSREALQRKDQKERLETKVFLLNIRLKPFVGYSRFRVRTREQLVEVPRRLLRTTVSIAGIERCFLSTFADMEFWYRRHNTM